MINSKHIETEFELVQKLSEKLVTVFNTDTVVTEMSAGYGIVDLVFARDFFSKTNVLDREPINNYLAVKVLLSIPDGSTFICEDISKITGASKTTNLQLIRYLLEKDYIKKVEQGIYTKKYKPVNPIKKIIAIEAKLKDWKQGILQARRYKSFTDECYLAILSKYEKNIDMSYLERFGIGLILFNPENGKIILKTKPSENKVKEIYEEASSLFAKELFLYESFTKTSRESLSKSSDILVNQA